MEKTPIIKPWVIADTRDKPEYRWQFNASETFAGTKIEALPDGDYSLDIFVNQRFLYIDRKKNLSEIASNLFSKADKERFIACLERLHNYRYKYIIVEEDLKGIYYNMALKKMHMKPDSLIRKIIEISMDYNINFIFAGSLAKQYCLSILKRALERFNNGNKIPLDGAR